MFAFYSQVLLQVLIILTGNYNFFNLLTLTLCLSLVDDQFIFEKTPMWLRRSLYGKSHPKRSTKGFLVGWLDFLCKWLTLTGISVATVKLFGIRISGGIIQSNIQFTKHEFREVLKTWTPAAVYIGGVVLFTQVCSAFYKIISGSVGKLRKMGQLLKCMWFTYVAVWMFGVSLIPLTELDHDTRNNLWPIFNRWHDSVNDYHVANSYGLFRSMTGVGGRPELVIEGSNNLDSGWREYNFIYKPGNISSRLPVCTPHQPRLDWQMWFAALGSYQHNPWFVHLLFKLLHGEPAVLNLLADNPFPHKPPRYVRGKLYKYHYTQVSAGNAGLLDGLKRTQSIKDWWRREFSHEYMPPLEKDNPGLVGYIQDMGWDPAMLKKISGKPSGCLYNVLFYIRQLSMSVNPTLFMIQLVCVPVLTNFYFFLG